MTGMAIFFIAIIFLVLITLATLLLPLLRSVAPETADRRAVNLAIAKQRLRELSRERENGTLGEEAFAQAKAELELTLAGDLDDSEAGVSRSGGRWMAGLIFVIVPVTAGWLYFKLGSPLFLEDQATAAQTSGQAAAETPANIAELVSRLEQRMKETPDDPEGQRLLIRTYMSQERFGDAVAVLESWGARDGDNPDLMVMLADASAAQSGGRLIGGPENLLDRALQLNPNHRQALWIMGYAQAQKNNARDAIDYWQRLIPLLEADAAAKERVLKVIEDMRLQSGLAPTSPAPVQAESSVASQGGIVVEVDLDPDLVANVSPDAAVFVYAKTPSGPPMPLAVVKLKVSDLPVKIKLDDSSAMIASHTLSGQSQVTVGARVSLGGGPVAQAGDFYTEAQDVAVPSTDTLKLLIDTIK